jgi:hypothetical protein
MMWLRRWMRVVGVLFVVIGVRLSLGRARREAPGTTYGAGRGPSTVESSS